MGVKKTRKEMLVTLRGNQSRIAILEDGKPVEFYADKPGKQSIVGNIYLGRVSNILPGMSAAFVNIGMPKNALLCFQDMATMEDGVKVKAGKIRKPLKAGDTIAVQVVKDPMHRKGARLSTSLSIPGRFLVFMPKSKRRGISKRLSERERKRLRQISEGLELEEGGFIIRTAASGASKKDLIADLSYLTDVWREVKERIEREAAPALVYQEPELLIRVLRDSFTRDFKQVLADGREHYEKALGYFRKVSPEMCGKVKLYEGEESLFRKYGVKKSISEALQRNVSLPSGGYIVIDETEALTAIDVNTGSYTGKKNLESTVFKTNMEAISEIVRQVRLRDIGGIIIIDFIDMEEETNRKKVVDTLERELLKDRTKTQVVTLSPLGLVEMTRKNVTGGISDTFGTVCPKCNGLGLLFEDQVAKKNSAD